MKLLLDSAFVIKITINMIKKQKLSEVFDASMMRTYFSMLGKRSLQTMTPEQRSERAKKAVETRWKLSKEKKSNQ